MRMATLRATLMPMPPPKTEAKPKSHSSRKLPGVAEPQPARFALGLRACLSDDSRPLSFVAGFGLSRSDWEHLKSRIEYSADSRPGLLTEGVHTRTPAPTLMSWWIYRSLRSRRRRTRSRQALINHSHHSPQQVVEQCCHKNAECFGDRR